MSNFIQTTKHPKTGKIEPATWLDDYFGPHQYGVKFSDHIYQERDLPKFSKIFLEKPESKKTPPHLFDA